MSALPPLPEPADTVMVGTMCMRAFLADQMLSYGSECIAPYAAEVERLRAALNCMLTFFGMDEEEHSKAVFDQARAALEQKP